MLNQDTKREWMAGWTIGEAVARVGGLKRVEEHLQRMAQVGQRSIADLGFVAALAASVGGF